MHESGSRRFGATTAGPPQLDGASMLRLTHSEHGSTQRELEEETEEGERGDARSPGSLCYVWHICISEMSLPVCTHVVIHVWRKVKKIRRLKGL